jgi:hypothetical protein
VQGWQQGKQCSRSRGRGRQARAEVTAAQQGTDGVGDSESFCEGDEGQAQWGREGLRSRALDRGTATACSSSPSRQHMAHRQRMPHRTAHPRASHQPSTHTRVAVHRPGPVVLSKVH